MSSCNRESCKQELTKTCWLEILALLNKIKMAQKSSVQDGVTLTVTIKGGAAWSTNAKTLA